MGSSCRKHDCVYYANGTETCDYLLITRERRGCPVDGCTRYVSSRSAKDLDGESGLSEFAEKFLALYDLGYSDSEISRLTGRSRSGVAYWRIKLGLPSQREVEVSARDS